MELLAGETSRRVVLQSLLIFLVELQYQEVVLYELPYNDITVPHLQHSLTRSAVGEISNNTKFANNLPRINNLQEEWLRFSEKIEVTESEANITTLLGLDSKTIDHQVPVLLDAQRAALFLRDEVGEFGLLVVKLNPKSDFFGADDLTILTLLGSKLRATMEDWSRKMKWNAALTNLTERYGSINFNTQPHLFMSGLQLGHDVFSPWNRMTISIEILENHAAKSKNPAIAQALAGVHNGKKFMGACAKMTFDSFKLRDKKEERVQLSIIGDEIVDILEMWATDYRIDIKTNIEKMHFIRGDSRHIRRIFYNLGRNAIDALSVKKGRERLLHIKSKKKDSYIEITFKDTGYGIDPTLQKRIFEPFFTTRIDGNGLGLTLVEDLVIHNGGNMSLKSDLGGPTFFIVKFPEWSNQ
jgi:signal transduction histidine kinase